MSQKVNTVSSVVYENEKVRQTNKRPRVPPTIHEVSEENVHGTRTPSVRSQESKKSDRSKMGSTQNKQQPVAAKNGYENSSYDGPLPDRHSSNYHSGRSSGNTSTTSLETIKEQYCCCTKLTPRERKLTASIAVMVTIIIVLIIAVALIAVSD